MTRAGVAGSAAQLCGQIERETVSWWATYLDYWRRYYGPTMKTFEAVGEAGREALASDLFDLVARFNRADDGTMVVPSEYLETGIVKG